MLVRTSTTLQKDEPGSFFSQPVEVCGALRREQTDKVFDLHRLAQEFEQQVSRLFFKPKIKQTNENLSMIMLSVTLGTYCCMKEPLVITKAWVTGHLAYNV